MARRPKNPVVQRVTSAVPNPPPRPLGTQTVRPKLPRLLALLSQRAQAR